MVVTQGGGGKTGWLRFYGFVDFSPGPWVGIEYDKALGKHDGSKDGKAYFSCKKPHGAFVRPDKVKRLRASTSAPPTKAAAAGVGAAAPAVGKK